MPIEIYIDEIGGNYVGAVKSGEKLVEYRLEKKNKTVTIGSIFKGRVEKVLTGMQAAFVNVGLDRNGYLSVDDMIMDRSELVGKVEFPSILDLKEGDEIMVQAVKDPAGSKGVRLTNHVSFAGRYVVFMPNIEFLGVSRKITDEKARNRLYDLAKSLKKDGFGLIVRTAALDAKKSDIRREVKYLIGEYAEVKKKFESISAPACLHEEGNLAFRLIRDVFGSDTEKVVVGDAEIYEKMLGYARKADRRLKGRLQFFKDGVDMFRRFGLEEEVDALLDRKVYLSSGAYIVIDKTEALTAIDVNTGAFVGEESLEETVFKTNLMAAEEIARQLRLRNISGIIVVDFIDMTEEKHRQTLLKTLEEALKKDRERCNLIGMTELGLVQITRKKRRRESASSLLKTCPYCQGMGQIHSNEYTVMKIRAALLDLFADGYENATIDLNVETADYILSKNVLKNDVEKIYVGKRVYIIPHKTYHQHFFIVKGNNDKAMQVPDKAVLLY